MYRFRTGLIYILSTSVVAQNAHKNDFEIIPEQLTPQKCLEIASRGKNNKDHFLCLANSMVRNSMKTFKPVNSTCNNNLELDSKGKNCYSVRASLNGMKKDNQHKNRQSAKIAMYYATGSQEFIDDSIDQAELTLDKEIFCKPVYQVIKKEGGGYGTGSSVTIIDLTINSQSTSYGMEVMVSYSSTFKGVIGGVTASALTDRSRTDSETTGKGSSATFQGSEDPCEPVQYRIALVCQRQRGLLKLFSKGKLLKSTEIKEEPLENSILMPLNEMSSEYFLSVSGCISRD